MLAAGRGSELEGHVPELARAIYPLVKFCDEMFEKAAERGNASSNKAADLLLLKTQPMETLKQQGLDRVPPHKPKIPARGRRNTRTQTWA